MSFLTPNYNRLPVTFEKGSGVWLWDAQQKQYFDALSGIAVCNLGHAHPAITQAIIEQSKKIIHSSNLYNNQQQERLAEKLAHISNLSASFFCNSGSEANETAIKLTRRYGHAKGFTAPKIICMNNSFHGRTLGSLSATGQPKTHTGFTPLLEGFIHVPFNDLTAIETIKQPDIVAVMLEPIQGEGGIRLANTDYLISLRNLCDARGWLLIFDEIQTGMGRTGHWFAHQHYPIKPDVMTLAKGLGNGFPVGACMMTEALSQLLTPGTHGSTFGGNHLAMAVALAVIETIENEGILNNVILQGEYLLQQLTESLSEHPSVIAIRGQGLMIGIELNQPCGQIVHQALERGLLINVTQDNVIRLLPPLIIDKNHCDHLLEQLINLIKT